MKTALATSGKGNNQKVKRKTNFKLARLPDNKNIRKDRSSNLSWRDYRIIGWISKNSAEILTLSQEELEKIKESPPIVRIFRNREPIRGLRYTGFLKNVDQKNKKLVIEPLGAKDGKQNEIRIPIESNIELELPVTEEK